MGSQKISPEDEEINTGMRIHAVGNMEQSRVKEQVSPGLKGSQPGLT